MVIARNFYKHFTPSGVSQSAQSIINKSALWCKIQVVTNDYQFNLRNATNCRSQICQLLINTNKKLAQKVRQDNFLQDACPANDSRQARIVAK